MEPYAVLYSLRAQDGGKMVFVAVTGAKPEVRAYHQAPVNVGEPDAPRQWYRFSVYPHD
jgi:hypothetical protein